MGDRSPIEKRSDLAITTTGGVAQNGRRVGEATGGLVVAQMALG